MKLAGSATIPLAIALVSCLSSCGGGGGGGTAGPAAPSARAEAPHYNVVGILEWVAFPQTKVSFAKTDGTILATHSTACGIRTAGFAVTSDGYVRVRCSRDSTNGPSKVLEFDPSDWTKAPVEVVDELLNVQALNAVVAYSPNGEEFYNRTVFSQPSGQPVDTLFLISKNAAGTRISQDVLTAPGNAIIFKVIFTSDNKNAYVLATTGTSSYVYELDLASKVTKQLVNEVELISDIAINGSHLLYTRIQNAVGQAREDMVVVDRATATVVISYDFSCPNDALFSGINDFGGKIVVAGNQIVVGSGVCYEVFDKSTYALRKIDYQIAAGFLVNEIPYLFDGTQLWATRQSNAVLNIVAYSQASWQSTDAPSVTIVPSILPFLFPLSH